MIAGASGARMWDDNGNSWLDFSSQMVNVNIGHQHPRMVAAIKEQADRLCTIGPPMANDMRSEAARLITELAPGDLNMVFFTNGGAEAIENATRMARLHTERHKVLSTYKSYHGATAGAISLTGEGRRWDSEPGIPGAVKFWGPYPYRSAFNATSHAEECERALAHLRATVHGRRAAARRGDPARDRGRHQRDPRPARRLPAGRARAVRRARDRDDL